MSKQPTTSAMNNEQKARRKLLKMTAYVPPAILGVMISDVHIAEAAKAGNCKSGAIVVSANGNACCPCVPGDPTYNVTTCLWERCKLGKCSACPPGPYTNTSDCKNVSTACGCICTSTKVNKAKVWTCN